MSEEVKQQPSDAHLRIRCNICDGLVHSIEYHIKKDHPDWTSERYRAEFPDAPLLSDIAAKRIKEKQEEKAKEVKSLETTSQPLHEIFNLGNRIKAAKNARGEPIPVTVLSNCEDPEMIPEFDSNYVFDVETLKNALLALELKIPLYVWGHTGTGKTSLLESVCAATRRPMLRVQHTVNTEESHIIGQWTASNGATKFELGPLALAMKRGWVYLADEYDFAMPSVLAVYQPILEGKSLVIKEANEANRIIKPHPHFRFVATGNTNGSGDETGLYQGTAIQNAANYDRFGVVLKVNYMSRDQETKILMNQTGIEKPDAEKIVDFAARIREQYDGAKISSTISPRTLINIANLGRRRGDYSTGVMMAFANKLNKVDFEVVRSVSQRIFASEAS